MGPDVSEFHGLCSGNRSSAGLSLSRPCQAIIRQGAGSGTCRAHAAPIERGLASSGGFKELALTRDDVTLADLRRRLNDIDRQLITQKTKHKNVCGEVARGMRATGQPARD